MVKTTVWDGIYKEIHYEIKRREQLGLPLFFDTIWTSYIYIIDSQKNLWERFRECQDMDTAGNIIEMHGGVTFFEREEDYIKIGCDYVHGFDMDEKIKYDEFLIEADIKKVIDNLISNK